MLKLTKFSIQIVQNIKPTCRSISCTATCLDYRWREKRGLPTNPNSFGPLTNLPDYTYMDGRQVPLGSNLRKRLLRQREIAGKIVEMCGEIDYAKERYARNQKEKSDTKQRILDNKLKPKGHLLLKKQ